ncbi:PPC domain-containing protein [Almyronema epifaneia]|uniref:PPC domain-containing protein n=1 Tax=Almyronema epifaneia S1 TaxID=2991925 RepID=A0ABW6I9Q8_9CYAN
MKLSQFGVLGSGAIAWISLTGAIAQAQETRAVMHQPILQVRGMLQNGDATLGDNSLFDKYLLDCQAGQTLTITLESVDFDAYLMVYDAQGQRIAQNDDISPVNRNAAVTVTVPADGIYRIVANAYNDLGNGQYKLSVITAAAASKPES